MSKCLSGKHAEHIFGEIYHEAMKLDHKTNTLQQRVDRLYQKINQNQADGQHG